MQMLGDDPDGRATKQVRGRHKATSIAFNRSAHAYLPYHALQRDRLLADLLATRLTAENMDLEYYNPVSLIRLNGLHVRAERQEN